MTTNSSIPGSNGSLVRFYAAQVSGDGRHIAYARFAGGTPTILVKHLFGDSFISHSPPCDLEFTRFHFVGSNGSLAALADSQGNEQKHLLLLNPNRQQLKVDLPAPVVNVVNSADNSLLVSVRTDTGQDLWAVDTRKATSRKIASGPGVVRWFSANQGSGEFFTIERAKEGMQWSIRSPKSPSSTLPIQPPANDPFQYSPIGVLGQRIFALERPSDGFSRIVSLGIRDGQQTVVAAASGKDISSICFEPTGKPAFAEIAGAQPKSIGLTRRHQLLIETYQRLIGAHVRVVARRSTGDLVIAQVEGRQTYSFIDRHGEATWYRSLVDCLEPDSEYFDEVIETRSRDGLRLEYIVSTPTRATHGSTVVLIHGGPWTHDTTDFSREVSEYISRGCQVVRVNFRGSTGYGTRHLDAGDKQWGRAIVDDIEDVLFELARHGRIDPRKLIFAGHSFGGYAALVLARRPNFSPRAVIAISAPVNLVNYVQSRSSINQDLSYRKRIGELPGDAICLAQMSPNPLLSDCPTLLIWGKQDARIPVTDIENFVEDRRSSGLPVQAIQFEDEGHVISKSSHREHMRRSIDQLVAKVTV